MNERRYVGDEAKKAKCLICGEYCEVSGWEESQNSRALSYSFVYPWICPKCKEAVMSIRKEVNNG